MSGSAADYEIYVSGTDTGGTPSGPGFDTWLNLGTTRTWTLTNAVGNDINTFSGTYQIGLAGTATALGSATFNLSAEHAT